MENYMTEIIMKTREQLKQCEYGTEEWEKAFEENQRAEAENMGITEEQDAIVREISAMSVMFEYLRNQVSSCEENNKVIELFSKHELKAMELVLKRKLKMVEVKGDD